MKIVRLLDGDPTTPLWAMGCWYGRTVGRRRVSEAVSVGRRVALATVLEGAKTAGLTVRAQDSETDVNREPRSARRSMFVDVELTDISED